MKAKHLILSIFLILAGTFSASLHAHAAYSYYYPITITSSPSVASGTLTNFPVLFSGNYPWLKPSVIGGRVRNLCIAPNGGMEPCDLAFTTSTPSLGAGGFTCAKAPDEVESYDTSGNIDAWFLTSTTTASQQFYACVGDASLAADQSRPSSTWDANYKGVYHLADAAASTAVLDSTSNVNAGTANQNTANTATASGQVDGAQAYNGTSDFFGISTSTVSIGSNFTVSGWFNKTAKTAGNNNDRLFSFITDTNNWLQFSTDDTSGKYAVELLRGGGVVSNQTYGAYDTGSLHYLSLTASGTTVTFYRDGVSVAPGTAATVAAGAVNGYSIGRRADANSTTFFKGTLDEARISNSARTPSWILTEYNNQSNPATFYSVGSEVSAYPTVSFSASPAAVNIGSTSTLSWTLTNASSAVIDQGIGSITVPTSAATVTPSLTTTYTLTATNPAGTSTAQATVTVLFPLGSLTVGGTTGKLTISGGSLILR